MVDGGRSRAAGNPDLPLEPGSFLYVGNHFTGLRPKLGAEPAYTVDGLEEVWIPADQRDEWLERRSDVSPSEWLPGVSHTPEDDWRKDHFDDDLKGEWRAPCGSWSYLADNVGKPPCRPRQGSWWRPTPEFLAALPDDPAALLRRLQGDPYPTDDGARLIEHAVYNAEALLRTGLTPRYLRAALRQALRLIPGIKVAENVANLDGITGVALGYIDVNGMGPGTHLNEVILDPVTDQLIGTRHTLLHDLALSEGEPLEKGRVVNWSALTIAVVDKIGVRPT